MGNGNCLPGERTHRRDIRSSEEEKGGGEGRERRVPRPARRRSTTPPRRARSVVLSSPPADRRQRGRASAGRRWRGGVAPSTDGGEGRRASPRLVDGEGGAEERARRCGAGQTEQRNRRNRRRWRGLTSVAEWRCGSGRAEYSRGGACR
jgi:hypothetical protein